MCPSLDTRWWLKGNTHCKNKSKTLGLSRGQGDRKFDEADPPCKPVRFPPGQLRLATSPNATGSGAIRARNGASTAPFTPESQSFLDHLVAGFSPNGSWSDPHVQPHDATVTALAQAAVLTAKARSNDPATAVVDRPGFHNHLLAGLSPTSPTTQSCAIPISWRSRNSL